VLRPLLLFAGILTVLLTIAGFGAQAAGRPRVLAIELFRDRAATEGPAQYLVGAPIVINVESRTTMPAAVSLTATAPDGTTLRLPLARNGTTFTGNLRLAAPGTWTLALSVRFGTVTTALANIALNAVREDGPVYAAGLGFALSALQLTAGISLLARKRS
jgi:hypothetical protein